jgi:hypothetical protein
MNETSARPRKALGPERPIYFDSSDVDRVMSVVLALASEVSALRDRVDTHERLAANGIVADAATIEAYTPDPATLEMRAGWRDAYIRRLFRVIVEDVEELRAAAP